MAFNPLEMFDVGQKVGQNKKSSGLRTIDYAVDQFGKSQEQVRKQGNTGVFSFDPLTGDFKPVASVSKGSIVRNTTSPEDLRQKASIKNQFESPTLGESQARTNAEELLTKSRALQDMLSSDKDVLGGIGSTKLKAKLPFGGFDKTAQTYEVTRADVADRILRLRSGAQINEQEYQRLSRLLPTVGRFDEVDIENLKQFDREYSNLASRINSGARWDEASQQFVQGGSPAFGNTLQQSAQAQSQPQSQPQRKTRSGVGFSIEE